MSLMPDTLVTRQRKHAREKDKHCILTCDKVKEKVQDVPDLSLRASASAIIQKKQKSLPDQPLASEQTSPRMSKCNNKSGRYCSLEWLSQCSTVVSQ